MYVKYRDIMSFTKTFLTFVKEKYIDEKNQLLMTKRLRLFEIEEINKNKLIIIDNIEKLEKSFLNHQLKLLSFKTEISVLENYLKKNSEGISGFDMYYKRIEKETDEGITLRLNNLKSKLSDKELEYVKEKTKEVSEEENYTNISEYRRSIRTKELIKSGFIKENDMIEFNIREINDGYNKMLQKLKNLLKIVNDKENNHDKISFILKFTSLLEYNSNDIIKKDFDVLNDLVTSTLK